MNWLFIVAAAILIVSMIVGFLRGFVKSIFSLFSFFFVLVAACFLAPHVDRYVENNTQLYQMVEERCIVHYERNAMEATNSTQLIEPASQDEAISILGIDYPKQLQERFKKDLVNYASESGAFVKLGKTTANIIIESVLFFLTLIVLWMIIRVIEGILDLVAKLPVLNGTNKVLGILVGFVEGILILWLLAFALSLFCTTNMGSYLLGMVKENNILTFVYENNGFVFLWNLIF